MGRAPGDRGRLSHSHLKTFSVAANEYAGNGKEKAEYPTVVTWDKLAPGGSGADSFSGGPGADVNVDRTPSQGCTWDGT